MTKPTARIFAILLLLTLLLSACTDTTDTPPPASSEPIVAPELENAPSSGRLEDDFYTSINGEWLENTEIPAGEQSVTALSQLTQETEELLMRDFDEMIASETPVTDKALNDFLQFYALASDYGSRNESGVTPLRAELGQVQRLNSVADFQYYVRELVVNGYPMHYDLYVDVDLKNTDLYVLYAGTPSLFLSDKAYYEDGNEVGETMLTMYEEMLQQLFMLSEMDETTAAQTARQAMEFDRSLAPYMLSTEQAQDLSTIYNPTEFTEFIAYSNTANFSWLVPQLLGRRPTEVIVTNPEYFEHLDELVNDTTFPLLKSWMLAKLVVRAAPMLSEDFVNTWESYETAISGREPTDKNLAAYRVAFEHFSDPVGLYFGSTYLGDEARQQVSAMADTIKEEYKRRLSVNNWLSAEATDRARLKLEQMTVFVGYPDSVPAIYQRFSIQAAARGGTVYGNSLAMRRIQISDNLSKFGTGVDRNAWPLSAATVNAYYDPTKNALVFPAAILQAPFYSSDYSESRNYGGIGAVIAHEMSHAFDVSGSLFLENGNMESWWTDMDYASYEARIQPLSQLFDGVPYASRTVNGERTKAENVADASGLACASAIVKSLSGGSLEDFFVGWAEIWRTVATYEMENLQLIRDTRAPAKLRVNIQLGNCEDFYSTYSIQETDGMYIPPEERTVIW